MTTPPSNTKSNFWWYIAAAVVIIIIAGLISYELTVPPSTPTASPTPTVTPSTSPSTSPSSSPSSSPSTSPSPSPSGTGTALTLYAGSVTSGSGTYGFGNSASDIVSPGPTLNLKVGTTYTMTVNNVATNMLHSWEIVSTKVVGTPLFGAGIGVNNFIPAGGSGSVTFTPDQAGNFYYVCTVPGHIDLGMWGNVVVSS